MKRLLHIVVLAILALLSAAVFAEPPTSDGVLYVKSKHSVADTVIRAKRMLEYHNLKILGEVDYTVPQAGDEPIAPTTLLLFGQVPEVSSLVRANRLSGLDLPLKLLVWEDAQGIVWISYNHPAYLSQRHRGLADEDILQMTELLRSVVEAAAK